jgi:hypothetical protein
MLKRLSATAVASAAMLAATLSSPATAAMLYTGHSNGHPNVVLGGGQVGQGHGSFTNGGPKYAKPVRTWVCGPIVNYDGTPHCHWVTH